MKEMTFRSYDITYEVKEITAIASCDNGDEDCRQDALLVIADNGTEKWEYVVFGWTMPESEEAFEEMSEDFGAWEDLGADNKIR